MIAFYRSLGLAVDQNPSLVQVHLGDQMINFHQPDLWQGDFALRAPAAVPPCGDLCFVWPGSAAALAEALDRADAGIVEGPVERVGGRGVVASSVYVRDPDGNLLEFMIYPERRRSRCMSADLVIRGGTVVDGSGQPGRVADVTVTGGMIEAIGPRLDGDVELDASGCVVAPGFIDIHTHFDAQVFWDPHLKPSSYHGVTTVVAGNCGFSIAPCRPEHHDVIVHTLESVEGMDPATLSAGIAWEFETFPDYLDLVGRRGTALNFTAYIGHTALRLYVMGDAAYERAATPEEIERMCQFVDEAMQVGAAGLSTSFSFAHRGVDGKPVPSRFAEMDEVEALFMAVGKAGKGVVLTTPGWQCEYPDVFTWQARVGRPFTCPLFALSSGKHREVVQLHEEALARGANVWPQVTPRPLTMQFTLADAYNLNIGEVFGELIKVSPGVRKAAYRDQEWRTRAFEDLEQNEGGMRPRWETFEVSESEQFPELVGRRVTDIARERDCQPPGRDVRARPVRGPGHPLPGLYRQRRRGRSGEPAHRGPRGPGPHRCRCPCGPAV